MRSSCVLTALALLACYAATAAVAGEPTSVISLWPDGLPEGSRPVDPQRAEQLMAKQTSERITYVAEPTLTLYRAPTSTANGCGVIVCPGGGYNILAWEKEGIEIAEWFNSIGVTAGVLKYRVPRRDPDAPHKEPLQDAQRAIRIMRQNAEGWGVDPQRIGILGFSAGGNLATMAGLHWNSSTYALVDDADGLSCRPDFVIPIYAAYLGDADDPTRLNALVQVTKETPPMFMAVTWDDKWRGLHSALLFAELKKAEVPAEVHVYSKGGHGYGLRPSDNPVCTWHERCGEWLRVSGLLGK